MDAESLREFAAQLIAEITDIRRDNTFKQLRIDQLTARTTKLSSLPQPGWPLQTFA